MLSAILYFNIIMISEAGRTNHIGTHYKGRITDRRQRKKGCVLTRSKS